MSLVNVLKQILHSLDAPTCFNIDVAVEQPQEVRVVRHNPSIVELMIVNFFFLAIFTSPINRVGILTLYCDLTERSRVSILT
jgi:hypothetical protein